MGGAGGVVGGVSRNSPAVHVAFQSSNLKGARMAVEEDFEVVRMRRRIQLGEYSISNVGNAQSIQSARL